MKSLLLLLLAFAAINLYADERLDALKEKMDAAVDKDEKKANDARLTFLKAAQRHNQSARATGDKSILAKVARELIDSNEVKKPKAKLNTWYKEKNWGFKLNESGKFDEFYIGKETANVGQWTIYKGYLILVKDNGYWVKMGRASASKISVEDVNKGSKKSTCKIVKKR